MDSDRINQRLNLWSIVGTFTPIPVEPQTIGVDDEVAAELQRVVSCSFEALEAMRSEDLQVSAGCSPSPHPPDGSAADSEGLVSISFTVDQHGEGKALTFGVSLDVWRLSEGDDDDVGVITKGLEVIANCGHVHGTGQSMNVPVEDQNQVAAAVGAEIPPVARGDRQVEVGGALADSGPLHGLPILHDVATFRSVTRNPVASGR